MSLTTQVFNSLTTILTPAIGQAIQADVAEYYDPISLDQERDFLLDDLLVDDTCFNNTNTTSNATATVGVGSVTGLGSVDVYYIELIAGTEDIEVYRFGLDGSSWSGTWKLDLNFTNVTAEVSANITAGSCNLSEDEILRANVTLMNPTAEVFIDLEGETNSLVLFLSSSSITSARITNISYLLGPIAISSDNYGGGEFVVGEEVNDLMVNEFSDSIQEPLLNMSNEVLADEMPYEFS